MSDDQGMGKYIEQFQVVLGLRDQGRLAEAIGLCRKYVDSRPPIGDGWNLVASAAQQMGDIFTAVKAARLYVQDNEEEPARKLFLAGIMGESALVDEAARLANENIEPCKSVADYNFLTGMLNAKAGQSDVAAACFRQALAYDPGHGRSWEYLAHLSRIPTDSEDFAAMKRLEKEAGFATTEDRPALLYALGKAGHDGGDFAEAWRYYSEGAGQISAANPPALDGLEAYLGRQKNRFSIEFVTSFEGTGSLSDRPIFIVGMPASGTRLAERILSHGKGVQGGGEMALVRLATRPIKNMEAGEIESFIEEIKTLGGGIMDPWKNLADNYLSLLTEHFGPAGRVIDRHLGNHLFLGVIRLMFPRARIIYLRRRPLDMAMACFRTRYSNGNDWSYDFENIARYSRLYEEIMSHWQGLFPNAILEVTYEELTEDWQAAGRRLLGHCGLSGPLMARPKDLSTDNGDSAEHYMNWLEPFRPLFESNI